MTLTLVATPDPEPFDIHQQPTWIALGIGLLIREQMPEARPVSVSRRDDAAFVVLQSGRRQWRAYLLKDLWSGIGVTLYVDEVIA